MGSPLRSGTSVLASAVLKVTGLTANGATYFRWMQYDNHLPEGNDKLPRVLCLVQPVKLLISFTYGSTLARQRR